MIYFAFFILFFLMPHSAYAWGPGVHIGVSISIFDQINPSIVSLLLANLNEYLYGALAPDFIVGKKYADDTKHTHSWDIGFDILNSATTDRQKAFGFGYLTHLAADAVAHGLMIPRLVGDYKVKSFRHFYIESLANIYCDKSYKYLAKKVLKRYNYDLDTQFKFKVDSVLFSFSVSKVLFKKMLNITFTKQFEHFILSKGFERLVDVRSEVVKDYIELSKQFAIDIIKHREDSKVVNIRAISR